MGHPPIKHSVATMLILSRAMWLFVPMTLLCGGAVIGALIILHGGDAGYKVLAVASLLVYTAGLLV